MLPRSLRVRNLFVAVCALTLFLTCACDRLPQLAAVPSVSGAGAAELASPTPAPTRRPTPSPTPQKTAEQITLALPASRFLDAVHAANGVSCQACHADTPGPYAQFLDACLKCHGGSYAAVATRTERLSTNPHRSHIGQVACNYCHNAHAPFDYYCASCHKKYENERFN